MTKPTKKAAAKAAAMRRTRKNCLRSIAWIDKQLISTLLDMLPDLPRTETRYIWKTLPYVREGRK